MKKRRIFSLITALTFAAAPLVTAFHMRAAERTFMLDAGHGGSDSGAVYNGRLEKNDNLRITLAVGERLARSGERVLYTRTDDSTVDLTYRSTMANSAGATYFVSFHRNSASTVGRGVEVYYYTGLSAQSTAARMAAPVPQSRREAGEFLGSAPDIHAGDTRRACLHQQRGGKRKA